MYEQTFQLKSRPFSSAPDAGQWCDTPPARAALEQIVGAIQRGMGISLLIGGPGMGKSLLLEMLVLRAAAAAIDFVQITCSRLDSRRDLLQRILFELNIPCRDQNDSDLRLTVIQHLRSICGQNGREFLLLVDEAHNLAVELLDELRIIAESAARGSGRCHMVLAGTPRLEERLIHTDLDAFNQRIVCRSYLQRLGKDAVTTYIQQHLRRAGGGNRSFFPAAVAHRIAELTGGVPRLINQLCDRCLVGAAAAGLRSVSVPMVEEGWCELQNLPRTAVDPNPRPTAADSGTIEFGSLDDEPSGLPAPGSFTPDPIVTGPAARSRPTLEGTPFAEPFQSEEPVPAQPTQKKSRTGRKQRAAAEPQAELAAGAAPRSERRGNPPSPPRSITMPEIHQFPSFEATTADAIAPEMKSPAPVSPAPARPPANQAGNEPTRSIRIATLEHTTVQQTTAQQTTQQQPVPAHDDLAQTTAIPQPRRDPAAEDDRDLIVRGDMTRYEPTVPGTTDSDSQEPAGTDHAAPALKPPHRPRAMRMDYRQLFAQLRNTDN